MNVASFDKILTPLILLFKFSISLLASWFLNFAISASFIVERLEVRFWILTPIDSNVLSNRFCTAPSWVCFSLNKLITSLIESRVSWESIPFNNAKLKSKFVLKFICEEELEYAKDWLINLKTNLKAFDSDSPKNFLITEEASIAVLWNAEAALAKEYNSNIDIIFPKEGIALSIDNFAIPKGSKNIEDTYLFIDYVLREDVMKKIIESYPYKNINIETDKLLSDSYLLNDAANVSDNNIDNGFFVKNIGEKIKLYDKIWAQIK